MNATEARKIFDAAIANATDADHIAKLEVLREYFTNGEFRKQLEQVTFEANSP